MHGQIGDETHPGLARLSSNLNMLETAGTPVLTVPYGYSEGPVAMFEFFKERLAVSEEKQ